MPNPFEEYDTVLMAGTNLTLQQELEYEQREKDNFEELLNTVNESTFFPTLSELRRAFPEASQRHLNLLLNAVATRIAEKR
jgi:hypothetical protein